MTTIDPRLIAGDLMLDAARDILTTDIYAHVGQAYDATITRSEVTQITTLIRESGIDITWPDGGQDTEVNRLRELIDRMKATLDGPCGSCHPCQNWADETWRRADRKPPAVITWDDAQAELKALRAVARAAEEWAKASVAGIAPRPHEKALYAAVKALPDPAQHIDLCTGYGCPGCRTEAGEVQ